MENRALGARESDTGASSTSSVSLPKAALILRRVLSFSGVELVNGFGHMLR